MVVQILQDSQLLVGYSLDSTEYLLGINGNTNIEFRKLLQLKMAFI